MATWEEYDTMEIRTTLSWETNHDDDYDEWCEKTDYEWHSWEDTFKGRNAIAQILSDSGQGCSYHDDYVRLNETTIIWRGKEVKCDLSAYDERDLSIPLLEMIWEEDGAEIELYLSRKNRRLELERRNEEYWKMFDAHCVHLTSPRKSPRRSSSSSKSGSSSS